MSASALTLFVAGIKTPEQSGLCSDVKYRNSIDAAVSRFASKTKSQPSISALAVVIWKGGARERADEVFFAMGIKNVVAKRTLRPRGTSGDTELFEKPSNINGFRASEQKNILYIPPH